MPIVIDPQFSVYRLVERVEAQGTLLRHRRTMSLVSYEIENATLVGGVQTRIFAGFQRFSKFLPQLARYEQIASQSESIYIFGIPDVQPPAIPNITYVPLSSDDQLANEWFVISYGHEYCSALATKEVTRIADPDGARLFKGVWTFDLEMVSILEDWLTNSVDARPLSFREEEIDYRRHIQLMSQSMGRIMTKLAPKDGQPDEILQGELRTALKEELNPALTVISAMSGEQGQEREAVILYAGLRNFSHLASTMWTRDLANKIIDPFLKTVSNAVYGHGGIVDKLLGDRVVAVFEMNDSDAADRALAAAKEIIAISGRMPLGIGISQGPVLVRTFGSDQFQEQTIIGDAVNTAQYLSQMENLISLSDSVYKYLTTTDGLVVQGRIMGETESLDVYFYQQPVQSEVFGA
jgi:class 3 adenylate cyclase/DICT domain-containing protein